MPAAEQLQEPELVVPSEAGRIASFDARAVAIAESNAFIVAILGACTAILAANFRAATNSDTWYSLVAGRLIANNGLPHHDTLAAMTLGRTWVDQEWLGHLAIYGLFVTGGWPLALLGSILLYTLAFGVLAVWARLGGASERSVALVLLAAFVVGAPNTALRAQTGAYLLFALTLAMLLADELRPSRRVYLTLPLLVVWANVHGSVLLGAALVSVAGIIGALSRRRDGPRPARTVTLVVVPWACLLASPYAFELPGYYRRILGNSAIRHSVTEWARGTPIGQPFFFALLAAAAVLLVFAVLRRSVTALGVVILAATAVLGVAAIRNQVWFALAAAAVLPRALDTVWPPSDVPRRRRMNLMLGAGGAAVAVLALAWAGAQAHNAVEKNFPPRAAASLAAAASRTPEARIFTDEQYADWLLYEDPSLSRRIAYDIRYELLSDDQLRRIAAFRRERGPDWQAVAAPYDLLVLNPGGDSGAIKSFKQRPGTQVISRRPGPVVLRQGP